MLLPYCYWKRYGDTAFLKKFYPVMRGYAEFMIANTGHKSKKAAKENPYDQYVYEKGMHLGEWLEPEEFQDKIAGHSALHTEEATAYLHYTMRCMAEAALALRKAEDAARYSEYAEGAKKAYRYLFLRSGAPDTDRQAKLVRPLALGLAEGDEELKKALEDRLAQAVERREYRIATGFLSTPFVLGTLTKAGRVDLAYKMPENEQCPGWLYEVDQGATTIWEDWEKKLSQNHYSPGAVCQWLFDTAAGIRVDGENRFVIRPIPGGSLTWAEASYHSIYGEVRSRWERTGKVLTLRVTIPANTFGRVVLPDRTTHQCIAGEYAFTWKQAE